jgi:hypothetical protein
MVAAGEHVILGDVVLLAGDVDGDDVIGLTDLVALGRNYNTDPVVEPVTDLNADGKVNIFDLVLIGANYGLEGPSEWPDAPATPTPTPTFTGTPTAPSTITPTPSRTHTPTNTPTSTISPTPSRTPTNSVRITDLDPIGGDEFITIHNHGPTSQSLEGWRIRSLKGNEMFAFPAGFSLGAGADVDVHSGPIAIHDPPAHLRWTYDAVWADAGDEAALLRGEVLVDRWPYGSYRPTATPTLAPGACIDPSQASWYVGTEQCVDFVVENAYIEGPTLYLESDALDPLAFYVPVPDTLWVCWPPPIDAQMIGKRVTATGMVESYQGAPFISLTDCIQLVVLR